MSTNDLFGASFSTQNAKQLAEFAVTDLGTNTRMRREGEASAREGTVPVQEDSLSASMRHKLREKIRKRRGSGKQILLSDLRIESLLDLDAVVGIEAVFRSEGDGRMILPLRRFVGLVEDAIVAATGDDDAEPSQSLKVEVRRWCMSFALKEDDPFGLLRNPTRTASPHSANNDAVSDSDDESPLSTHAPNMSIRSNPMGLTAMLNAGSSQSLGTSKPVSFRQAPIAKDVGTHSVGAYGLSLSTRMLQSDKFEVAEHYTVAWTDFTGKLISEGQLRELADEYTAEYRTQFLSTEHVSSHSHTKSASVALVNSATNKLFTGGRDGLVKEWSLSNGTFHRNVYNAGFAWITALSPLHDGSLVAVTTSDSRLSVLDQGNGSVIRTYKGCDSLDHAATSIMQRSTLYTQRYGLLPGTCGPRRLTVNDREKMKAAEYESRSRDEPAEEAIPVTPMIDFLQPSSLRMVDDAGLLAFGCTTGKMGLIDLAEDLRRAMTIIRNTATAVKPTCGWKPHTDAVTGVAYADRYHTVLSCSLDGTIQRYDLEDGGRLTTPANSQKFRPFLGLEWCEQSQMQTTWSSDKKIRLWSLLRPDPLHAIDASIGGDILAVAVDSIRDQLHTVTSDQQLRVYDLRTLRCLQTLSHQEEWLDDGAASCVVDSRNHSIITVTSRPTIHQISTMASGPAPQVEESAQDFASSDAEGSASFSPSSASMSPSMSATQTFQQQQKDTTSSSSIGAIMRGETVPGAGGRRLVRKSIKGPSTSHGQRGKSKFVPHHLSVVASVFNPETRTLFTFDACDIHVWDIVTGESISTYNVMKQLRPLGLNGRSLTTAVWEGGSGYHTILTGTQEGDILCWNPLNGDVRHISLPPVKAMSAAAPPDVNCLATHQLFSLVCRSNVAHIVLTEQGRDSQIVLPPSLAVPQSTTITAAAVLKDRNVVLGTLNGELHFHNLSTGRHFVENLFGSTKTANSAVEAFEWVNRDNQGLLVVTLSLGSIVIYSFRLRRVVYHTRLFRPGGECQLLCSGISTYQDNLFIGDSLGQMYTLDILGFSDKVDTATATTSPSKTTNVNPLSPPLSTGGGRRASTTREATTPDPSKLERSKSPPGIASSPGACQPPIGVASLGVNIRTRRETSTSTTPASPLGISPGGGTTTVSAAAKKSSKTRPIVQLFSFRPCSDGVTSITYLKDIGGIAVTSFDKSVRLYHLGASTGANATHIGDFGKPHRRDSNTSELQSGWDVNDEATYAHLPLKRANAVNQHPGIVESPRSSLAGPSIVVKAPAALQQPTDPMMFIAPSVGKLSCDDDDDETQSPAFVAHSTLSPAVPRLSLSPRQTIPRRGSSTDSLEDTGTFLTGTDLEAARKFDFNASRTSVTPWVPEGASNAKGMMLTLASILDRQGNRKIVPRGSRTSPLSPRLRSSTLTGKEDINPSGGDEVTPLTPRGTPRRPSTKLVPKSFSEEVRMMMDGVDDVGEEIKSSPRLVELEDKLRMQKAQHSNTHNAWMSRVSSKMYIEPPTTVSRIPHLPLHAPVRPPHQAQGLSYTARQYRPNHF